MKDQQESRQLIAGAILPDDGPLSDSQRAAAAEAATKYLAAAGIRDVDIARGSGIPLPQVRRVLRGEAGDEITREVNSWIELDARAQASKCPKSYVPTAVAQAMFDAATAAHRSGDIALAYGPSGLGKTFVCEAIAAAIPGVIYVYVGVGERSVRALMRRVFDAAGRGGGSPHGLQSSLISLLKGTGRLLIIDQAHKLTDRGLEWLFDFHDATACPMLLTGTVAIRQRLDADADPAFGQLYSRCGIRVDLVRAALRTHGGDAVFTAGELRQIFSPTAGRLRLAPDATMMLVQVANTLGRGSLRLCARLVAWAARLARKQAGVGPDDVVVVYAEHIAEAERVLDDSIEPRGMEAPVRGRVAAAG